MTIQTLERHLLEKGFSLRREDADDPQTIDGQVPEKVLFAVRGNRQKLLGSEAEVLKKSIRSLRF